MIEINDFIVTTIKGHYSPEAEDRLTQVFLSCFNHSTLFRITALNFFGFALDTTAIAKSQITTSDGNGRLDILITASNGKKLGVIENKIDALLTGKQLKKYQKAGHKKVVAITRKYPKLDINLHQFRIFKWSGFYDALASGSTGWSDSDRLLVGGFLQYLEELGMIGLQRITKHDLIAACNQISHISNPSSKYSEKIISKTNPFSVFHKLTMYFQYVWEEANNDQFLRHRMGKNFRFAPFLAMYDDNKDGTYENPMISFRISTAWKGRSKKIVYVGLFYKIHPTNKQLRGFYIRRYYKNRVRYPYREKKLDGIIFRGNILDGDKLANTVIKQWKLWLQ